MRQPVIHLVSGLLLGLIPMAQAAANEANAQSILVLDASGSMRGQIDGRSKIEIAREAVDGMLDGWQGGGLGLMAYGHRRKGDCQDIEMLVPVGAVDAAHLRQQVGALQPKGMTPISAAVRAAAEQLRFTEQKATVILVSDGEETCDADPCAVADELEQLGVDFTAHVIGFDIQQGSVAQSQLECLASRTGGRYIAASDARALNEALDAVSETATVSAVEGEAWIEGVALEAENGIYMDPNGQSPAVSVVEFHVGQTAEECQALCNADPGCAGWHYEPTGSYFVEYPRCFMQGFTFAVRLREEGDGWVAGIKPGVKLIQAESTGEP